MSGAARPGPSAWAAWPRRRRSGEPLRLAGDITPAEAWRKLEEEPDAVLIDVRTRPEWAYVGVPDLSGLGRKPLLLEWQSYPDMQVNPSFADQLQASGVAAEQTVMFLCRSGARSRAAAIAVTAQGYGKAFNVAGGFEGDPDEERHRGNRNGWKHDGLPWVQQ